MPDSVFKRIAVATFGALSLLGGWMIAYGGGFHHLHGKYSSQSTFVDGAPAVLMAALQLLAAALAFTWMLRCRLSSVPSVCLAFGGVFLPPLLYTLIRWL